MIISSCYACYALSRPVVIDYYVIILQHERFETQESRVPTSGVLPVLLYKHPLVLYD